MIKGAYIFYEVIINSQILSSKFIKKIREVLLYKLSTKVLYTILTKPIDMTWNVKQTIRGGSQYTATICNNHIYEKSKDQNFLRFLLGLDNLSENILQLIFEIW